MVGRSANEDAIAALCPAPSVGPCIECRHGERFEGNDDRSRLARPERHPRPAHEPRSAPPRYGGIPFIVPYATGGDYSYLFLSLVQSISSLVATPLWTRIASRLERGQTMLIACIVEAAGLVLIGVSIEGGGAFALAGAALVGLPGGTVGMLPFLMASDASDYSRFRHGGDTRGLHISLISMIAKVSSFIATLVLTIVGALGINPSQGVSDRDVLLIQMIGLYIPAVLVLLGGMVMYLFPITRRRHSTITRRLERLALVPDPAI